MGRDDGQSPGDAGGLWACCERLPPQLAFAGAALIAWIMFGRYDRLVEFADFAALVVAVTWDWRLKWQTLKQENRHG